MVTILSVLFVLVGFQGTPLGLARTYKILGVKLDAGPTLRVLADESEHSNQYRSLRLFDVNLAKGRDVQKEWIISRRLAKQRQRKGLYDVHRADVRRKELAAIDDAEANGFEKLTPLKCEKMESRSPSSPSEGMKVYSWRCVLKDRGISKGLLEFRVGEKNTTLLLREEGSEEVHKIAEIDHREVESRRMGTIMSPASGFTSAFMVPGTKIMVLVLFHKGPPRFRGGKRQVLIWTQLGLKRRGSQL
jgi:hypothetical protein